MIRRRPWTLATIVTIALTAAACPAAAGPPSCTGDCDGDGAVGVSDLSMLIVSWSGPGACDLDGDGIIDVADLVILITNWGECALAGACCSPDDLSCQETDEAECTDMNGVFLGPGSSCAGDCIVENVPTGACCTVDDGCVQVEGEVCDALGGIFHGEASECAAVDCCTCAWSPDICALVDCNGNGVLDTCDVESGISQDCDEDGYPDECANDCNGNGLADSCDLDGNDCNANEIPDECEIDCDDNGVPDDCDLESFPELDCDANGILDICELEGDDCNGNGVPDACDVESGFSADCNLNLVPDECEILADCDGDGIPDACEQSTNCCSANGSPGCESPACEDAVCAIDSFCCTVEWDSFCAGFARTSPACQCAEDCNGNGIPDGCDIGAGTSDDLNANGVPDECDISCTVELALDSDNDGEIDHSAEEAYARMLGTGKMIAVNDDDDDESGTPDLDDPPGHPLEDDLVPIVATVTGITFDKVWELTYPDQVVRVYEDPLREVLVPSGALLDFPVPGTFWVEGVSPSASAGDVIVELTIRVAGQPLLARRARARVTVLKPVIETIDFMSGIDLYDPATDMKRPASGPEWTRGGSSFEAAYVRTNGASAPSRKLDVTMSLNVTTTVDIKFRAVSSDPLTVDDQAVRFKGGSTTAGMTLANVPDTIERFENLEWTWEFDPTLAGANWKKSNKSTHTIYVIRARPAKELRRKGRTNDRLYHQYYELTCEWAAGKKDQDETFEAIWDRVKTLTATPYGYHCPSAAQPASMTSARPMLITGNGHSGAWARWFVRILEAHGIDADLVRIKPNHTMGAGPAAGAKARSLWLEHWSAPGAGTPYTDRLTNGTGLAGQRPAGTSCPTPAVKVVPSHDVVSYDDHADEPATKLYDVAYGKDFSGATLNLRLEAWDPGLIDFLSAMKKYRGIEFWFYVANPAGRSVKGTTRAR